MADAGWYPDAMDDGWQAYYDGQHWTAERRPTAGVPPQGQAPGQPQWQPQVQQPQVQQPQVQQPQGPWRTPTQNQPQGPWQNPTLEQPQGPWQQPQPQQPQGPWHDPAHAGGWQGRDGQRHNQPPAQRRNRKPLFIVGGAVVLLAAGLVTWLVWPDDAPQITYNGKQIASASKVLSKAEDNVQATVKKRHGVSNGDTRCYFAQPKKPASGGKTTDVDTRLRCGPVLFVDGDKSRAYLSVPLTDSKSGSKVQLEPSSSLDSLQPLAVGSDVKLTRPDGKSAPDGSGTLSVPKPPPAQSDVLTAATLGPTTSPASLKDAVMVGMSTKAEVSAAGEIDRYGVGDDARAVPSGKKLIAFQVTYGEGDVSGGSRTRAKLVVDGGSARALPETSGGDEWIVAAVPSSGTAQLVLTDGGFTQTLDLPGGRAGPKNIAVLRRTHRTAALLTSFNVPVRASRGSASLNLTFRTRATLASLDFWPPRHETVHASSPSKAILSVGLTYTNSKAANPSKIYGYDPQLVRLRLPGGQIVKSRNIAAAGKINDVFEVPATFTTGRLEITGSEKVSGITLRITKTIGVTVSIPAG